MSGEAEETTPVPASAAEWQAGTPLRELTVTPDRYTTIRYAGASGDFNPIHIDDDFARQVGLPGRILHGLWTMAQVARAVTEAAGPEARLERLEVDFRGMGVAEEEIAVSGEVEGVRDGVAAVKAVARQGSGRLIRKAKADVRVAAPQGREPA